MIKRLFISISLLFCLLVTYVLLIPFLWSPIYDFEPVKPFSGDYFYNPYKNIDSTQWFKANFHAHANVFGGITNGRINTSKKINDVYAQLGYKIHSVSNYMNIDLLEKDSTNFIPSYEHGYSPFKYHQVVIGARKVFWFDFPLLQTLSNKQYIINHVKEGSDIFAIGHPEFQNAYDSSEITKLTGFRLMEVLNQRKNSFERWDDALSAGNLCFIIGDDDVHDLNEHQNYAVSATLVNTHFANRIQVVKALKQGRTVGYEPLIPLKDSFERKVKDRERISFLTSFNVDEKGVIEVKVNQPLAEWEAIGQGGKILHKEENNSIGTNFKWHFEKSDTYIRFNLRFLNKDKVYTNPVFRYDGKKIYERQSSINWLKTFLYRGVIWLLLSLIIFYIFKKT